MRGKFPAAISDALAKSANLDGVDLRVCFYLASLEVNFENVVAVDQSEIAQAMDRTHEQISRSIGKLIKEKVIIAGPREGRYTTLRFNPDYGKEIAGESEGQGLGKRSSIKSKSIKPASSHLNSGNRSPDF